MESATKNRQSEAVLRRMVSRIFGTDEMTEYKELTEGYFNVAYEICLKSGLHTILKVAPPKEITVMSYERNIMTSEVEAMKMVENYQGIPAAKVYGYDDSCTVCPSPYFFMEKLEGESLNSLREGMPTEELQNIQIQTGQINRKINEIVCPRFGYPGLPKSQGTEWYPVFQKMIDMAIADARARDIDLQVSVDSLRQCLLRDRGIFEEVKEPRLVHWDCWDGNIFVKDGKVTGLIDWERCLFADPLMEVGFRTYGENIYFRKGYGLETLTPYEKRRAVWYDIYTMLLAAQECEYRKYETMDMYNWSTGVLKEKLNDVIHNPAS